jgi:hypothetical protein
LNQEETITVKSKIQTESPKVNIQSEFKTPFISPWVESEPGEGTPCIHVEDQWTGPVTETVKLCRQVISTTFNSFLRMGNIATAWFKAESPQINPWKSAKASEVIHRIQSESSPVESLKEAQIAKVRPWTQVEYSTLSPCIDNRDLKVISWIKTEYHPINTWSEVTSSNTIPWTQVEFPQVDPFPVSKDSKFIPRTQAESLPEYS